MNKDNCRTFHNRYDWSYTSCQDIKRLVGGYELELLLMAISISLLLTGPGRISIEWDVLKKELFPRRKAIVQQQKDAA
jgi:uncharacterized membrane protein YphA (DoxX/SURF4 family)